MSDPKQLPDHESSRTSPPTDRPNVGVGFARRRRLLKLGTSGVGIAATLASRPVLALTCSPGSAWGSALMNPSASVQANAALKGTTVQTWTLANWVNDTTEGSNMAVQPWAALTASGITVGTVAATRANYKVSDLFAGLNPPLGLEMSAGELVGERLTNDAVSPFAKYMLAARLNLRLAVGVQQCLVTSGGGDQLNQMATGTYTPPNVTGASAWDTTAIITYLQQNNVVRAS